MSVQLATQWPETPPTTTDPVDREIVAEHGEPYFLGGKLGTVQTLGETYWAAAYAKSTRVLFDPAERSFFAYDGSNGLWTKRTSDEIAKELRALMLKHSRLVPDIGLERHIKGANLQGVLSALRGHVHRRDAFGGPPRGIHVANGYLELGEDGSHHLRGFSPDDMSRNQSPIRYDPEATCPRFLDQLLRPAIPEEDITLLQRWLGVAINGHNFPQRFMLISGTPGGGKGTFSLLVQKLIGRRTNCCELRPEHVGGRFETKRFMGKTLLYGNDVSAEFLRQKGGDVLKRLVGGDSFSLEGKGSEEELCLQGDFSVLITSNFTVKLRLEGDTGAWRRRLLIIHYNHPPPTTVIPDFEDVLLREEGSGILNWALEGLAAVRREGYKLTQAQAGRIEQLLANSDSLRQFVMEKLEQHDASDIASEEFHNGYKEFCADHGWDPAPHAHRDAGDLILDVWKVQQCHGILREGSHRRGWRGLRLVDGQIAENWNDHVMPAIVGMA